MTETRNDHTPADPLFELYDAKLIEVGADEGKLNQLRAACESTSRAFQEVEVRELLATRERVKSSKVGIALKAAQDSFCRYAAKFGGPSQLSESLDPVIYLGLRAQLVKAGAEEAKLMKLLGALADAFDAQLDAINALEEETNDRALASPEGIAWSQACTALSEYQGQFEKKLTFRK